MMYYEALDLVIQAVTERFDQPGYRVIQNLEECQLNARLGQDYSEQLDFVCSFYGQDLNKHQLTAQLSLLKATFDEIDPSQKDITTMHEMVKVLSDMPQAQKIALSQVFIIFKLLVIIPATNATSERSFSALRRVKTYLRSTMGQERLNDLLLLHVHKAKTDSLDLVAVAKEFVVSKQHRITMFGTFP